jgi:hypothetical protein
MTAALQNKGLNCHLRRLQLITIERLIKHP